MRGGTRTGESDGVRATKSDDEDACSSLETRGFDGKIVGLQFLDCSCWIAVVGFAAEWLSLFAWMFLSAVGRVPPPTVFLRLLERIFGSIQGDTFFKVQKFSEMKKEEIK